MEVQRETQQVSFQEGKEAGQLNIKRALKKKKKKKQKKKKKKKKRKRKKEKETKKKKKRPMKLS